MKINFFWQKDDGNFIPSCTSDTSNLDEINLITCILMDDGGQNYKDTIPWIDEGLKKIEKIQNGESHHDEWDRETWGCEITESHAKIYSLYEDDYSETISINSFGKALQEWKNFLTSPPSEEFVKTISI